MCFVGVGVMNYGFHLLRYSYFWLQCGKALVPFLLLNCLWRGYDFINEASLMVDIVFFDFVICFDALSSKEIHEK